MANEHEKIDFKPLSSGLGFHPFSDGLPYAPLSPSPQGGAPQKTRPLATGTGAVAAGTPTFATRIPKVNVPIAKPALETISLSASSTAAVHPQRLGFTYVLKRIIAYLVDLTLSLSLAGICFAWVFWNEPQFPERLFHSQVTWMISLYALAFPWVMITGQELIFKSTLGKRIFKLRLNATTGALLLRAIFFLPSLFFLGTGLLWCLFDPQRRCWHDLITQIQPLSNQS